jgi:hypothetical protein
MAVRTIVPRTRRDPGVSAIALIAAAPTDVFCGVLNAFGDN